MENLAGRAVLRYLVQTYWKVAFRSTLRDQRIRYNSLRPYEQKIFSQNGEDGLLTEIFRRVGVQNKTFVEIGVGFGLLGLECNTRYLLEEKKWHGLWIEASAKIVASLNGYTQNHPVVLLNERATAENVRSLLEAQAIPQEFDLLSIDVDGNDYYLWKNLSHYRPRVVVIEYNASFPAGKEWIMPYNPAHVWDYSLYYGASLESYVLLGKELGYSLVACDAMGVNAFFVRKDLAHPDLFEETDNTTFHQQRLKWPLWGARLLPRGGSAKRDVHPTEK